MQRVAEQVVQGLGEPVPVGVDGDAGRHVEDDLGFGLRTPHGGHRLADDVADRDDLRTHLQGAGLQSRGRQEVVEQPPQPGRAGGHGLEQPVALLVGELAPVLREQIGRSAEHADGGPQLVRSHRQELGLVVRGPLRVAG